MASRTLPILLLLVTAGAAAAEPHADSLERARATLEVLPGYTVEAELTVVVHQGTTRDSLRYELTGAALWPDRLRVRQEGGGVKVRFGTGPEGAWFHPSRLEAAYRGPAAPLDRDPGRASELDFLTSGTFSFLAGLAPFLLPTEPDLAAEPGDSVLVVDGRTVTCRVLTAAPESPSPDASVSRFRSRRYWVDPASGLVLRSRFAVVARRGDQDVVQIATYHVRRLDLEAPDAGGFGYTPPPGVRIVDHPDRLTNPLALTGTPAPDVTFRDLDGAEFRLSDFRGKVLFLDVWATWCPPCRQEMPHIQTLHEELGPGGEVVFLAVSSEPVPTIRGFLAGSSYTFRVATVSGPDATVQLRATNIPTGFVIDREGIVRAHLVGAQNEAQLRAALARAGVGD